MENKILPLPSGNSEINFLDGSSRKRKLTAADEWATFSETNLEHGFSKKFNLHKMNSLSGISERETPHGLLLDSKSQAVESVPSRHQFLKDQYHTLNGILPTLQSNNRNIYRTESQKINKISTSLLPKSFHCGGSLSLNKMLDGKTLTVSNGPSQAYNLFGQDERLKLTHVLEFGGRQAGKPDVGHSLQDMSFGYKNHVADNQSMEVHNSSPESLRPSLLHQSFVDHDELAVNLEGKEFMLEMRNHKTSDLKQNDPNLNTAKSSAATASLGHFAHTENAETLQKKTTVGVVILNCLSDDLREDDQSHRDDSIQTMKETKGLLLNSSLGERISPKDGGNPTNFVVRNDLRSDNSHSSTKLSDEKSKMLAGKSASTISEKLWDGSLQLNSSVSVSAVAFFKSGEKMPTVKWSEIVEVKGKVRLEAFERYIKDLSGSRNRGLMVISLCWKEGSSKSGLVGMKKVAKGYKEGRRVGFVHLSTGIDLYVCPHSDSIITILAKHGFLKGMLAVVDNQDSLIGCVVWRRNGASTNSAAKKSDRKNCSSSEQPLKSSSSSKNFSSSEYHLNSSSGSKNCSSSEQLLKPLSGSSDKRSTGKDLYCTQLNQETVPVASETESAALESAGSCGNEGKNQKTSEGQLELHNPSSCANLPLTSSARNPKLFSHSNCTVDSLCLHGPMAQFSEVETPLIHKSTIGRAELSLELQKPVLSFPFEATRQPAPALDYDDLPEYDFGTVCGVSHQMNKPVDTVTVDKKFLTEGSRKLDWSLQPTMSTVQSLSVFDHRRLQIFNLPRLPPDAIQGMPPLKKVNEHEGKQNTETRGTMIPPSATVSKNLFNDDDDMPEWCPPNAELCKLSVPPKLASTTLVPSVFDSFSASYPSHLAVDYPPPLPQAIPYSNLCSIDVTMKVVQPRATDRFRQRGPNSSIAFNAKPPSTPQPDTFSVKHSRHAAGWRGWSWKP